LLELELGLFDLGPHVPAPRQIWLTDYGQVGRLCLFLAAPVGFQVKQILMVLQYNKKKLSCWTRQLPLPRLSCWTRYVPLLRFANRFVILAKIDDMVPWVLTH